MRKMKVLLLLITVSMFVMMSNVAFGQTTYTATATSPGNEELNAIFVDTDQKFTFTVTKVGNNGEVTIGKHGSFTPDGALTLPSKVTCTWNLGTAHQQQITYNVTAIGYQAFQNCFGLTSVTIPGSVRNIGNSAFYNCKGLTNASIGSGVDTIDSWAFSKCYALKSLTIPNSVTYIGYSAFSDCRSIKSLIIPNSVKIIDDIAFYNCDSLTSVSIGNGVVTIGSEAFESCDRLTNVSIGNNVKTIKYDAFYYCTSLHSITIPGSVTSIGNNAFAECYSLASVTFAQGTDSLTIGSNAFANDTSLTSIDLPCRAYVWDPSAFAGCTNLEAINICPTDPNYSSYDGVIYSAKGDTVILCPGGRKTSYTIKNTAIAIGPSAFNGCRKLPGITIPSSVKTIGYQAFQNCFGLTSVTIPGSVRNIGNSAFYNCKGLTNASIGSGVDTIDSWAFSKCYALKSLTIPNSVTYIGYSAFSDCRSIKSLIIPNSVKIIDDIAFYNCDSLTSVSIGNGVVTIGSEAFESCDRLTNVSIGNNVKTIKYDAFYYCTSLHSITIPGSVTSIENNAFAECYSLASVTFAQGTDSLTIGSNAFANCTTLTSIYNKNLIIPKLTTTDAFGTMNTGDITLYIPCQVIDEYKTSNWVALIKAEQMKADGNNTVISAIRGHMRIPMDKANCTSTVANEVRIYPNSSIVFEDNAAQTQVYQKLNGKRFILQKNLSFDRWNLVPNPYDKAKGDTTYKVFNANMGNKSGLIHEMTGLPFDYTSNKWTSKYPKVNDTLPTNKNMSIFMWPFADYIVKGVGTDSTYQEKKTNHGDSYVTFTLQKGLAEVESKQNGTYTYTQKNIGDQDTNKARWFTAHNICIGRLDIAKFAVSNNSNIQGQGVYLFDANSKSWKFSKDTTINPGDGFLVASPNGVQNISVKFDRKDVHDPKYDSKKSNIEFKEIVFTTSANNTQRVAKALVDDKAQNGFDINDAYILISEHNEDLVEPYFLVEDRGVMYNVFQTLPYEAPINFHASKQSQVEFTMNNKYDNVEVSIVDVNTNDETILTNGEAFNFVAEEGENAGRYKIRFTKKSVGIEETENTAEVRFEQVGGDIQIFGSDLQSVEIINTLGQTIYNQKVSGRETKVENLSTGAYIIKVRTSTGTASEKIIIK